jgi:hypothetical protein
MSNGYSALDFSGLERRPNYRVIAYREDILTIVQRKEAAAILYHIVERWLMFRRDQIFVEVEERRKMNLPPLSEQEVEGRMWIYLSYPDFMRECGFALGYNTIQRNVEYLVARHLLERRIASRSCGGYEYRIQRNQVAARLSALPTHPASSKRRASQQKRRAEEETDEGLSGSMQSPSFGASHLKGEGISNGHSSHAQMEGAPTPFGNTLSTSLKGVLHPNEGGSPSQMDAPDPSFGDPTQKQQESPQNRSQQSPQQQHSGDEHKARNEQAGSMHALMTPVPAAHDGMKEEMAVKKEDEPSSLSPDIRPLVRPPSNVCLSAEIVVQLWEWLRGERYAPKERLREAQAASRLLEMKLPLALSLNLLEEVYHLYRDEFWQSRYGDLHLSHLIGKERSGSLRIGRWLLRLKSGIASSTHGTRSRASIEVIRAPRPPVRLIEWQGRLVPEEQAYREGYQGGFERFKPGDHPDDDLFAAAARLRAEGKLATCQAKEVTHV